uniref:Uncharacterized protein n=1 Tax=Spongospora subterranea TaxID=70186 RepID=A0A0H5R336_9EUKA|eukprot:CRZ08615.1 hypothetical protein [Spongospora subterranea]
MSKEMKKLAMKTEGTPLGRVMSLTGDFMEIVIKHGWENFFEGKEGQKLEVKFLLEAVRPFKLRKKMKKPMSTEKAGLHRSPDLFLALLKEKVRSHQEWEDSEERHSKKQRSEPNPKKHGTDTRNRSEPREARAPHSNRPQINRRMERV